MKNMIRPLLSRIARACGTALSAPRSDVPPPILAQAPIDGICGSLFISNNEWNIEWLMGTSMMGYCPASGKILRTSFSQCAHAYDPQESSTQRNPPFNMYSRSAFASFSSKNVLPYSLIITNGQLNNSGSVAVTT